MIILYAKTKKISMIFELPLEDWMPATQTLQKLRGRKQMKKFVKKKQDLFKINNQIRNLILSQKLKLERIILNMEAEIAQFLTLKIVERKNQRMQKVSSLWD